MTVAVTHAKVSAIADVGDATLVEPSDWNAGHVIAGLGTLATQNGTFSGTSSGTNTGDQIITLTGDVTGSGAGSFAATVANGAVTLAKMANMATSSLIYRKTAGSGAPEVNTLATLKTDLGLTGTNSGDQTITLTGDVTGSGAGSFAATIAAGAVTEAKQTLADNTTCNVSISAHGYVPKAPNDATQYLDGTGVFSVPAGSGGGLTIGQATALANAWAFR